MKPMNPKTKKFLSNFFFGLFSNDHAIEGSKSNPWWVALIILLVSIIIPVIPITVSASRAYGASFLDSYTYRFDQNIATVTKKMILEGKEFTINENHLLAYNGTITDDSQPVATHVNTSTNQYELMVYYTNKPKNEMSAYIQSIDNIKYIINTTSVSTSEENIRYAPSYVVLYQEGIYTRLNKEDSIEVGPGAFTNYTTDWNNFEVGYQLLKGSLPEGKTATQVDLNNSKDVSSIFNNWKEYYNKVFITQKNYNTLMSSLLFLGIYFALAIVMGLLVFLLTRGKNNMFNYLKFMDCQKIVAWATLSPAILAMIVGFIFANFAQMAFIILMGLRIMWISMKQLRPQY